MTAVNADSMLLQYPFLFFCRFDCSCMHLCRALIKRIFMRYDEIDLLFHCCQYRAFARYPAYSDSSHFLLIISKQKMISCFHIAAHPGALLFQQCCNFTYLHSNSLLFINFRYRKNTSEMCFSHSFILLFLPWLPNEHTVFHVP